MTKTLFETKSSRREKLIVFAEILGIARRGALKTHIMFKANLSFSQLNFFLSFLSRTCLLERFEQDGKVVYKTTRKGLEFLERHKQVMDLLNEDAHCTGKRV
jgi:predicted transcriptional regulator